jgi:hypothetical protein
MLKRGILTEIPHIEGRDFYPDLAKVGKDCHQGGRKRTEKRFLAAFIAPGGVTFSRFDSCAGASEIADSAADVSAWGQCAENGGCGRPGECSFLAVCYEARSPAG